MNRMNKLAELFGVEMGQYFTVEKTSPCGLCERDRYYLFLPDGLWYRSRIHGGTGRATRVLEYLLQGAARVDKKISKHPVGLDYGTYFYVPDLTKKRMVQPYKWTDDEFCKRLNEMGLVFLTKEKAVQAAKAMLVSTKLVQADSLTA